MVALYRGLYTYLDCFSTTKLCKQSHGEQIGQGLDGAIQKKMELRSFQKRDWKSSFFSDLNSFAVWFAAQPETASSSGLGPGKHNTGVGANSTQEPVPLSTFLQAAGHHRTKRRLFSTLLSSDQLCRYEKASEFPLLPQLYPLSSWVCSVYD